MNTYFVPYTGEQPSALTINGHRVVFLSQERDQLESGLELVGADRICPIEEGDFGNEEQLLTYMAHTTHAHVVLAPMEVPLTDVIESLQNELPWIQ